MAQRSVARLRNEQVIHAISNDLARPVVHARNLFHTSIAMYDAWAVYDPVAETYLLGKMVHGFQSNYRAVPTPDDILSAQEEAISFAVYRLILHRFASSPGAVEIRASVNALMDSLGYNRFNRSTNYKCGPAEMGNYIAAQIIDYGFLDGSNEASVVFHRGDNSVLNLKRTSAACAEVAPFTTGRLEFNGLVGVRGEPILGGLTGDFGT